LRIAGPSWRVAADGDTVVVQLDSPDGSFPAELALVRHSVVRREGGRILGTGPFTVTQAQPGRKMVLTAREDYWGGRPFLGSIDIDLSSGPRSATSAWSSYQLAEVAPEQAKMAGAAGYKTVGSAPSELLALVFAGSVSPEQARLRDALSLSIDRKVLSDVLLQGGGEPARGLLPGWMTGYDFLFSADTNLAMARQVTREVRQETSWTLGYDANNPIARLMAERIALNAGDAGIKLVLSTNGTTDARLVRLSMVSLDPHVALANLASDAGMTPLSFPGNSSEELYGVERSFLQAHRIIPLVHVKAAFALAGSVTNWTNSRAGDWHLADVWLRAEKQ
jgi:ABC-type transport system substrate-binding protein